MGDVGVVGVVGRCGDMAQITKKHHLVVIAEGHGLLYVFFLDAGGMGSCVTGLWICG